MAPNAAERLRDWLALMAPAPGRAGFAVRQALICALTVLVIEVYQTPDAALTIYLVFFLNKADRVTSLITNIALVVLLTLVIGIVFVTAIVVVDHAAWRVAAIAMLSLGFLFLASASRLRPVGAIIALIVGYALDLLGRTPGGEVTTRALLYAWLFAAIPAAVSIVVNVLLAPSPRHLVEAALATRLRVGAAMLRGPKARTAFTASLEEGPGEIPALLKQAALEKTAPSADLAALGQAAESTVAILLLIDVATREDGMALPATLATRIAGCLESMASILAAGGYPVDIELAHKEDESGLTPTARALVAELRAALCFFAVATPDLAPAPSGRERPHRGFFLVDAFSNPDHMRYALKTTAAALFCYVLYSVLDWPGIHTCFITCYIVALSTTAETVEKLALRILGCLVGAGAGIAAVAYVLPWLTSIGALMTIVFLGAFAASWVAAGSPRIAYAGFQIAFAFFICVVQGPAPAFDLVMARDRVVGILVGNAVAYLVFVHVWPVSVARRIDPAIADLQRCLRTLADAPGRLARHRLAGKALATGGAIRRDLDLLRYEPAGLRPGPDWECHQLQALDAATRAMGALLLAPGPSDPLHAIVTDRLTAFERAMTMAEGSRGHGSP